MELDARVLPIAAVIVLSFIGVIGDIFLKKASQSESQFASVSFLVGFLLYSSTAFGWVFAMKYLKMATVGAVYSVATILMLAIAGAVLFNERLHASEIVGISFALCALILLSRHS